MDYSILFGFDDKKSEVVIGVIDYLRQYDIVKKTEYVGKSVGLMVGGGKEAPTIIPTLQYKKRFETAMEKYFMTVPDKWTAHDG